MCMKFLSVVSLVLALVGFGAAAVACGGAQLTPPTPAGAASGLNTFIYVYTET
jgi:hypothetical protein